MTPKNSSKNRLPELIACIPTMEVLEGIDLEFFDAFYLGFPYCLKKEGNLLANPRNLALAIDRIKSKDKKAYLTSPPIPTGKDFPTIKKFLKVAENKKIEGIEVHDMGVLRLIKEAFPNIPIHVGHFANTYHVGTALEFQVLGAKRIIPSYELTHEEVEEIKDGLAGEGETEYSRLEIEIPVHGKLPLGMAYTCLFRQEFLSSKIAPCAQQCREEHFVRFKNWKMQSVGTAMVTAEDFALIEYLDDLFLDYQALRLETFLDDSVTINEIGRIYRQALGEIATGQFKSRTFLFKKIESLCQGEICNGWYVGQSGRKYIPPGSFSYSGFKGDVVS